MRTEIVRATRAQLPLLDDEAGSVLLDLVVGFRDADRARALRAEVAEIPVDWIEQRIVSGGILDASAAAAVIVEVYARCGRPEQAAAEALAFMETLAKTLGRLGREMIARERAELDAAAGAVDNGCAGQPRSRGGRSGAP